jgi:hypothetical protein
MFWLLYACTDLTKPTNTDAREEMITRVSLEFIDTQDHSEIFVWSDPQDGTDPQIDTITLENMEYSVFVSFWNDLSNPAENITEEVLAESEEHQIFFLGDIETIYAMNDSALLEQEYADQDGMGLPVGVENFIRVLQSGEGTVQIGLRHMPKEDDIGTKAAFSSTDSLPGSWDVFVDFPVVIPVGN